MQGIADPVTKLLMRFYATAICAICAYVSSSVFQENLFLSILGENRGGREIFFFPQRRDIEDIL